MMKKFENSYASWVAHHRNVRSGERLAQMDRREHHGEMLLLQNVLLPTLGTFTHLHPEYELNLLGARTLFLDIAYVNPPLFIDFELDGYDYHQNKISREQFACERKRDIMLKLEGWHVLRFAYDEVKDNPAQLCRLVRRLMEKYRGEETHWDLFNIYEREIVRMAIRSVTGVVHIRDVIERTNLSPTTARAVMRKLVQDQVFAAPPSDHICIHAYHLNRNHE